MSLYFQLEVNTLVFVGVLTYTNLKDQLYHDVGLYLKHYLRTCIMIFSLFCVRISLLKLFQAFQTHSV
jgi:hypothetical protein